MPVLPQSPKNNPHQLHLGKFGVGRFQVVAMIGPYPGESALKIRSPFLTKLVVAAFGRGTQLLFRTLRREIHVKTPGTNPYVASGEERFLYSVWHDSMLLPIFGGRHTCSSALVSRHQDGSYVAGILKMVGVSSVRGSTKHGGASAVRQMMTTAKDRHIVITPDGPRGPRRKLQRGIVFLASHSGRAIVPTAYSCIRSWRIKGSWTDLMIPKPFTKVFLATAEPIYVPPNLSRQEVARYTAVVQDAMDRLNAEMDRMAALPGNQNGRIALPDSGADCPDKRTRARRPASSTVSNLD